MTAHGEMGITSPVSYFLHPDSVAPKQYGTVVEETSRRLNRPSSKTASTPWAVTTPVFRSLKTQLKTNRSPNRLKSRVSPHHPA